MDVKALETVFEELRELLENKRMKEVKARLDDMNEVDAAHFLQTLPEKEMAMVFRILSKEHAAEVFACMEIDEQQLIINSVTDRELAHIIEELYVDDAVDLMEELPANVVKRIMRNATAETRDLINQFLKFPENSAGSIMTAEFVDLKKDMTVNEAFDRIRKTGEDKETIYTCYVTSKDRKLLGVVTVRDMLLSPYEAVIGDIMDDNVISAMTTDDRETVAKMFNKYDFIALPVVDTENRLVGIITVDDAMDVLEEEATEDIEKMAAITPSDRPYLKTGVLETWRARVPWLLILMISATFTGLIISSYESALSKFVVLTAFIPMLMDTGGNGGSQTSVTVIRSMSLGDIEFSDLFKVVWKEVRVALLCGLTLAVTNFVKLMVLDRVGFQVAAVVCITLVATVFFAKLVGGIMPMLAKKIGFDPAVMASPFITTIVDALSLIIYFRVAALVLNL
ncbi:MAG: magnesium transporter [Clostridiales bacterium]|jgi:magnesium transporter|nr:magnesium transporter [Clostridiales bacterium]